MSKSAIENLHQVVDLLADEIGHGALMIDRGGVDKDFALVSRSYLEALERKAEAYDQMTEDPDAAAATEAELLGKLGG